MVCHGRSIVKTIQINKMVLKWIIIIISSEVSEMVCILKTGVAWKEELKQQWLSEFPRINVRALSRYGLGRGILIRELSTSNRAMRQTTLKSHYSGFEIGVSGRRRNSELFRKDFCRHCLESLENMEGFSSAKLENQVCIPESSRAPSWKSNSVRDVRLVREVMVKRGKE